MILVYLQIGGSKAVRSVMSPTAAAITNNLDTAALLCIITCDNYDMLRAGKSPAFRCLSACLSRKSSIFWYVIRCHLLFPPFLFLSERGGRYSSSSCWHRRQIAERFKQKKSCESQKMKRANEKRRSQE